MRIILPKVTACDIRTIANGEHAAEKIVYLDIECSMCDAARLYAKNGGVMSENYISLLTGSELSFIKPPFASNSSALTEWYESCRAAEKTYFQLIASGVDRDEAKIVIPGSVAASIIIVQPWPKLKAMLEDASIFGSLTPLIKTEIDKNIKLGKLT